MPPALRTGCRRRRNGSGRCRSQRRCRRRGRAYRLGSGTHRPDTTGRRGRDDRKLRNGTDLPLDPCIGSRRRWDGSSGIDWRTPPPRKRRQERRPTRSLHSVVRPSTARCSSCRRRSHLLGRSSRRHPGCTPGRRGKRFRRRRTKRDRSSGPRSGRRTGAASNPSKTPGSSLHYRPGCGHRSCCTPHNGRGRPTCRRRTARNAEGRKPDIPTCTLRPRKAVRPSTRSRSRRRTPRAFECPRTGPRSGPGSARHNGQCTDPHCRRDQPGMHCDRRRSGAGPSGKRRRDRRIRAGSRPRSWCHTSRCYTPCRAGTVGRRPRSAPWTHSG